jgi:hypothetical protein
MKHGPLSLIKKARTERFKTHDNVGFKKLNTGIGCLMLCWDYFDMSGKQIIATKIYLLPLSVDGSGPTKAMDTV